MQEEELGTYYLTDFLARHFESLIVRAVQARYPPRAAPDDVRQLQAAHVPGADRQRRPAAARPMQRQRSSGSSTRNAAPATASCSRRSSGSSTWRRMPELTIIFWRGIPAQVTAGKGRGAARAQLSERFQEAIDAAAMRAGLIGTDEYLEQWRREGRLCERRPRGRGLRGGSTSSSRTTPTRDSSGSPVRAEKRSPRDRDRSFLGHQRGRDRLRSARSSSSASASTRPVGRSWPRR